jgi:hypothetical protein
MFCFHAQRKPAPVFERRAKTPLPTENKEPLRLTLNENEPRLIEKLDYSTAIAVGPGPRADAAVGPQIGPAHGGAQNPDG